MTTVYRELDRLINRGEPRESVADSLSGLGIGRYMACRWISMTLPKNAVVMSMFNCRGGVDWVGGICGVASLFGGRYGRFSYLKKAKTPQKPKAADDDGIPERFSGAEAERMRREIELLEKLHKKNWKKANGKESKEKRPKPSAG